MDLTIPAAIVKEHAVEPGDVFALDVAVKAGRLIITYSRVYGGE